MMRANLAVVILSYNEEINIRQSLSNVYDWAAYIYVLDSGSKDKTCDLAREYGAEVFSRKFEMYFGVENLTNFKQKNPILASDDPFGDSFDSTIIYAPIFGRMLYSGLRFKIN